jgi:hypothetical protein
MDFLTNIRTVNIISYPGDNIMLPYLSQDNATKSRLLCAVTGLSLELDDAACLACFGFSAPSENKAASCTLSISGAIGGFKLPDPFTKVDGTKITKKSD